MFQSATTITALLGIATHIFFFNRGEHHLQAPTYILTFLFSIALTPLLLLLSPSTLRHQILHLLSLALSFLLGLYTSLLAYRLFLHPLHSFPGPLGARISALWFPTQLSARDSHHKIHSLHRQYGPFVRIGPNDLSIAHPDAVVAIYGNQSKCRRAAWYDISFTHPNIVAQRSRLIHGHMRRVWSSAFGEKEVRGYEERMRPYREKVLERLQECAEQKREMDIRFLLSLFGFDSIIDLTYGEGLRMLGSTVGDMEKHWVVRIMEEGLTILAYQFPIWVFRAMAGIPGLQPAAYEQYKEFLDQFLKKRLETKSNSPDIMTTFLKPYEGRQIPPEGMSLIRGDSEVLITAGSDTTSATLTIIMYFLVKNPTTVAKLRNELSPYMKNGRVEDYRKIQNLPHLNGIINETLRLYPVIPVSVERETPREGLKIGDRYIPASVTVYAPQYVLGRMESLYPQTESFIPERWYSRPELVVNRSVFAPFSLGPMNCIGKPLAYQNIRITLAEIAMNFDLHPGPNNEVETFEQRIKVHHSVSAPSLTLYYSKRKGE